MKLRLPHFIKLVLFATISTPILAATTVDVSDWADMIPVDMDSDVVYRLTHDLIVPGTPFILINENSAGLIIGEGKKVILDAGTFSFKGTSGVTENYTSFNLGKNSQLELTGGIFRDNNKTYDEKMQMPHYGGAINSYYGGGNLILKGTSFLNNYVSNIKPGSAYNTVSHGGAIYILNAFLEMQDCTFIGNEAMGKAGRGGAVGFSSYDSAEHRFLITNCFFENNRGGDWGGALYLDAAGGAITNSTFKNNYTGETGGAVFANTGTFEKCSFEGNFIISSRGSYFNGAIATGGAADLSASASPSEKILVNECSFTGNYIHMLDGYEARGGALYVGGGSSGTKVTNCDFTGNYIISMASRASSHGGAFFNRESFLTIENCRFIDNYIKSQVNFEGESAGGGAIYSQYSIRITDSLFEGNHVSAPGSALGGAFYIQSRGEIIDSSFTDNFTMKAAKSQGGAIYAHEGSRLTIDAKNKDCIFKGNRQNVTSVDSEGRPIDGESNAIYMMDSQVRLHAAAGKKIIFHDDVTADKPDYAMDINLTNGQGWSTEGEIVFTDGAKIKNMTANLHNGTLTMREGSGIGSTVSNNSTLNADLGSTLRLEGFTSVWGHYNVTNAGTGTHLIYVALNDAMVAATEEKPMWDFVKTNSFKSSIAAEAGAMEFILDIKNVSINPEGFHPFLFSHLGQTEELMNSVASAAGVKLIDGDGWTLNIPREYTANGRVYSYFDFLSGQYGVDLPQPPVDPNPPVDPAPPVDPLPSWEAPAGVGSIQVNTLWTSVHSLWSFASNARTRKLQHLSNNRNAAFWISGLGDYYTMENQGNLPGYRYRSLGYSLGGEYTFAPGWAGGAALGESFGKHDINGGKGRFDKTALMGMLYLNRDIQLNSNNTIGINLQAAYENATHKGGAIMESLRGDRLTGKWKDQAWLLDLRTTWAHALSQKQILDTYIGIQYTQASQNDASLTGENYAYRMTDGFMNTLKASAGTGIRHYGNLCQYATMSYAGVGVIQDLYRQAPNTTIRGNNHQWTATGSKPGKTSATAYAGMRLQISEKWSLGADYSVETARDSFEQSGRVSIMHEF